MLQKLSRRLSINRMDSMQNLNRANSGPLLITIGPPKCGKSQYVQSLGEKVTEISLDESPGITTDKLSTESCLNFWQNKSDAVFVKKEKPVYGMTISERLTALKNTEHMYLALLFQHEQFNLSDFKKQMETILEQPELDTYIDVVTEIFNGSKNNRFVSHHIELFIPEALEDVKTAALMVMKKAMKNEAGLICWSNSNLDPKSYKEVLLMAAKYQRVVRFIRWGQELHYVSLAELMKRNIIKYLKTGRLMETQKIIEFYHCAEANKNETLDQTDFARNAGFFMDEMGRVYETEPASALPVETTPWSKWLNSGVLTSTGTITREQAAAAAAAKELGERRHSGNVALAYKATLEAKQKEKDMLALKTNTAPSSPSKKLSNINTTLSVIEGEATPASPTNYGPVTSDLGLTPETEEQRQFKEEERARIALSGEWAKAIELARIAAEAARLEKVSQKKAEYLGDSVVARKKSVQEIRDIIQAEKQASAAPAKAPVENTPDYVKIKQTEYLNSVESINKTPELASQNGTTAAANNELLGKVFVTPPGSPAYPNTVSPARSLFGEVTVENVESSSSHRFSPSSSVNATAGEASPTVTASSGGDVVSTYDSTRAEINSQSGGRASPSFSTTSEAPSATPSVHDGLYCDFGEDFNQTMPNFATAHRAPAKDTSEPHTVVSNVHVISSKVQHTHLDRGEKLSSKIDGRFTKIDVNTTEGSESANQNEQKAHEESRSATDILNAYHDNTRTPEQISDDGVSEEELRNRALVITENNSDQSSSQSNDVAPSPRNQNGKKKSITEWHKARMDRQVSEAHSGEPTDQLVIATSFPPLPTRLSRQQSEYPEGEEAVHSDEVYHSALGPISPRPPQASQHIVVEALVKNAVVPTAEQFTVSEQRKRDLDRQIEEERILSSKRADGLAAQQMLRSQEDSDRLALESSVIIVTPISTQFMSRAEQESDDVERIVELKERDIMEAKLAEFARVAERVRRAKEEAERNADDINVEVKENHKVNSKSSLSRSNSSSNLNEGSSGDGSKTEAHGDNWQFAASGSNTDVASHRNKEAHAHESNETNSHHELTRTIKHKPKLSANEEKEVQSPPPAIPAAPETKQDKLNEEMDREVKDQKEQDEKNEKARKQTELIEAARKKATSDIERQRQRQTAAAVETAEQNHLTAQEVLEEDEELSFKLAKEKAVLAAQTERDAKKERDTQKRLKMREEAERIRDEHAKSKHAAVGEEQRLADIRAVEAAATEREALVGRSKKSSTHSGTKADHDDEHPPAPFCFFCFA